MGEEIKTVSFKPFLATSQINGKYEIIQQGDNPIVGYADGQPFFDYKNVVLFGDHTLSLYKPKKPFFVATDGIRIVTSNNSLDINFLFSLLEKHKPKTEGYKRYFSILLDCVCFIALNKLEQTKIGELFSKLDNLITLHQRK